jgi:hypothetical protein
MTDETSELHCRNVFAKRTGPQKLEFLKIPQRGLETIRSNVAMKLFDEYVNVLKVMDSIVCDSMDDPPTI